MSAAHTFNRNVLVLQGVQYTCQCVHVQWLCMSLYNDNQNIQIQMLLHDATVAGVARYGDVPEAVLSRGKTVSKKKRGAPGPNSWWKSLTYVDLLQSSNIIENIRNFQSTNDNSLKKIDHYSRWGCCKAAINQRDPAGLPMGWIWTPNGVVGVSWYMGHVYIYI